MTKDRVALVTGGGAGIGEAVCHRLARDGRSVAVLGRGAENTSVVAKAIIEGGGRAISVQADVSDRGQVASALAEVRERLGPITILVNDAGVEEFCAFEDIGEDAWDHIMNVNLKGVYHVTQLVLPDMVGAGWGRIVNLTALGAQIGGPNMAHYTASKGGLTAMTRTLATELGPKGITVNAVSPGFILTPMAQRAIDGGLFHAPPEEILASYPIRRIGQPEEVAVAIAMFTADDAGYITGQTLGVNGGCCT